MFRQATLDATHLHLYENWGSIIYYAYSSVLFQITLVPAWEWPMEVINIIINKYCFADSDIYLFIYNLFIQY